MAMVPTVDPFAVEDPSELEDWHVPVSFMKSRHLEEIRAEVPPEESWRMKDRVGGTEITNIERLHRASLITPSQRFWRTSQWLEYGDSLLS